MSAEIKIGDRVRLVRNDTGLPAGTELVVTTVGPDFVTGDAVDDVIHTDGDHTFPRGANLIADRDAVVLVEPEPPRFVSAGALEQAEEILAAFVDSISEGRRDTEASARVRFVLAVGVEALS